MCGGNPNLGGNTYIPATPAAGSNEICLKSRRKDFFLNGNMGVKGHKQSPECQQQVLSLCFTLEASERVSRWRKWLRLYPKAYGLTDRGLYFQAGVLGACVAERPRPPQCHTPVRVSHPTHHHSIFLTGPAADWPLTWVYLVQAATSPLHSVSNCQFVTQSLASNTIGTLVALHNS